MATTEQVITVAPDSELARLLDKAMVTPLVLERDGVRYRLSREEAAETDALWAGYDPAAALAGIRAAAGSWSDIDAEKMKGFIYHAREEGSRPNDRP